MDFSLGFFWAKGDGDGDGIWELGIGGFGGMGGYGGVGMGMR